MVQFNSPVFLPVTIDQHSFLITLNLIKLSYIPHPALELYARMIIMIGDIYMEINKSRFSQSYLSNTQPSNYHERIPPTSTNDMRDT